MIKLDYFDLISDEPITIENVGSIKCPYLKDIKNISYFTYSSFVHCLMLTPQVYFDELEKKGVKVDDETFLFTTKYDLLTLDNALFLSVLRALNFFFVESVVVNEKKYIDESVLEFHTINEKNNIVGVINEDNYSSIVNVILQMLSVDIEKDDVEDLSKVKNKRGKKIYEKILKGRRAMKKAKENASNSTKRQSLPNIISSVAAFSNNTNYTQIWDLTIYQLYDLFNRLNLIDQYNITSTSVSVWGDEKKQFKTGSWNDNFHDKETN